MTKSQRRSGKDEVTSAMKSTAKKLRPESKEITEEAAGAKTIGRKRKSQSRTKRRREAELARVENIVEKEAGLARVENIVEKEISAKYPNDVKGVASVLYQILKRSEKRRKKNSWKVIIPPQQHVIVKQAAGHMITVLRVALTVDAGKKVRKDVELYVRFRSAEQPVCVAVLSKKVRMTQMKLLLTEPETEIYHNIRYGVVNITGFSEKGDEEEVAIRNAAEDEDSNVAEDEKSDDNTKSKGDEEEEAIRNAAEDEDSNDAEDEKSDDNTKSKGAEDATLKQPGENEESEEDCKEAAEEEEEEKERKVYDPRKVQIVMVDGETVAIPLDSSCSDSDKQGTIDYSDEESSKEHSDDDGLF